MRRRHRRKFVNRRRRMFLEPLEERVVLTWGYGDLSFALHDLIENNSSQLLIEATLTRAIDDITEQEIQDNVTVYYSLGSTTAWCGGHLTPMDNPG